MENRTTIALPGLHDFDITEFKDLLEHRAFFRLHGIKQLGLAYMVFPGATSTRFFHSVGTGALGSERAKRWEANGQISQQDTRNITWASLLHDIGHGPYSHAIEGVCEKSHKDRTIEIILQMRNFIESRDVDVDAIVSMMQGTNSLSCAFAHRCFGADKLHYLFNDNRLTLEAIGMRIGDLINHSHFIDGVIAIDQKIIPEAIKLNEAYGYMYDRVYLRKGCIIAQCLLQQILLWAMQNNAALREEIIWDMNDSELDQTLRQSSDCTVRKSFENLIKRRIWHKVAVMLLPEGIKPHDRTLQKSIHVEYIPADLLNRFGSLQNRQKAQKHERWIATIADIPSNSVLLIPVVDPYRFVPEDIAIFDGNKITGTLEEYRPAHYVSLRASAQAHAAIRVCVPEQFRERVASKSIAKEIAAYLMDSFCT